MIAKRNNVTLTQVARMDTWNEQEDGLPEIIPIPGSTREVRVLENSQDVRLTEQDMKDLDIISSKFEDKGARYGRHGAEWTARERRVKIAGSHSDAKCTA